MLSGKLFHTFKKFYVKKISKNITGDLGRVQSIFVTSGVYITGETAELEKSVKKQTPIYNRITGLAGGISVLRWVIRGSAVDQDMQHHEDRADSTRSYAEASDCDTVTTTFLRWRKCFRVPKGLCLAESHTSLFTEINGSI